MDAVSTPRCLGAESIYVHRETPSKATLLMDRGSVNAITRMYEMLTTISQSKKETQSAIVKNLR